MEDRAMSSLPQEEIELASKVPIEDLNRNPKDIMQLIEEGNFEKFSAALSSVEDINHRFSSQQSETLLERACRKDSSGRFVAALLERSARAEERNIVLGCSAVHIAAEALNAEALRLLFRRSDPNALNRSGNNALHVLCKRQPSSRAEECLKAALDQLTGSADEQTRSVVVNHRNMMGRTPVFEAAKRRNEGAVRLLLQHGCSVDQDDTQRQQGARTARHLLSEEPAQWAAIADLLPPKEEFKRGLVFLLYFREEDEFLQQLALECEAEPGKSFLNAHDGRHSLLQVAAAKGLERAVEALLALGAPPDWALAGEKSACEQAAAGGHAAALSALLRGEAAPRRQGQPSALQLLLQNAALLLHTRRPPDPRRWGDYTRCFDLLVERPCPLLLRDVDEHGRTLLHYAASYRMSYFVEKLAEKGAPLLVPDKSGVTPLELLSPADLRKMFDTRIQFRDPLVPRESGRFSEKEVVHFDVRFSRDFHCDAGYPYEQYDLQALVLISKSQEQRCVLTHPLVGCILHMKWKAIGSFYLFFLLLNILFAVLLVTRIFIDEYRSPPNSSFVQNVSEGNVKNDIHLINNDNENYQKIVDYAINVPLAVTVTVIIFLSVFYYSVSRDFLQLIKRCFLKILLAVFSGLLLSGIGHGFGRVAISNFALLLTSAELVFLLGDHPKLAVYVKMLQTVTWNFFKFFVWFSPLVLAFVFCFVILFRDINKPFVHNLGIWFFRTFVMTTGEYEAVNIMESTTTPVVSHVVFITFVFFLAIVLFNLLNALAVNDTIIINEDTELFVNISQINLLRHAEMVVTSLHKWCLKKDTQDSSCICRKIVRHIEQYMNVISLKEFESEGKVIFELNKNKWKSISNSSKFIVIDMRIIKAAENIKKSENADIQEIIQNLMQKIKN